MSKFLSLILMHHRGVDVGWDWEERHPSKARAATEQGTGLTSPTPSVIVMEPTTNHREGCMLPCRLSRGCLRS
jgi:hypothetical protein